MSPVINLLSDSFGAEILNVSLSLAMSQQQISYWQDLIFKYQVVVFRNQLLTPIEQIQVCQKFGNIEPHPLKYYRGAYPEMTITSNVTDQGEALVHPGPPFLFWHADGCYLRHPPKFSFFYAHEVPERGGDTLFINTVKAYEDLDSDIKNKLRDHKAVFGYGPNLMQRCKAKGFEYFIGAEDCRPDVIHPVFRRHPVTGLTSIFVNETHTDNIIDLDETESNYYLNYLYQHCEQKRYIYTHQYRKNDLVVWDNNSTIHSGDYLTPIEGRRVMHRVVVRF